MVLKIMERFKKFKMYDIKNIKLPDKTKALLSILWAWSFIMFHFTRIMHKIVGFMITNIPDSCIVYPSICKSSDGKPEIMGAKMGDETITNKLKMLVDICWDETIGDNGGVNTKKLISKYPSLSSSIVWVVYMLDMGKKIERIDDTELGKSIKLMFIDIGDKSTYKEPNLKEKCDIVFGEIPF